MKIYNKYRPAQDTRPLTCKTIIRIYASVLIFLLITIILATGYILVEEKLETNPKVFKSQTQAKAEKLAALDFYDYFSIQEEIDKHQAYLDYIEQNNPPERVSESTTTEKAVTTTTKKPRKTSEKSEKTIKFVYNLLEVIGKTSNINPMFLILQAKK